MSDYDIADKNWDCPKKRKARSKTIIEFYRKRYGRTDIPGGSQYWTLCGKCGSARGMLDGSELHQLLEDKFLQLGQFYGVDLNKKAHKGNLNIAGANWINNDFYSSVEEAIANGTFRPALVNYDSIHYPKTQASYFCKLLKLLTDYVEGSSVKDMMLVSNFILRSHKRKRVDNSEITRSILGDIRGRTAWDANLWEMSNFCYVYDGTGTDSRTTMGTVVFSLK